MATVSGQEPAPIAAEPERIYPKWRRGLRSAISTTPIKDGNILLATDTGEMFVDIDGARFQITDFITSTKDIILAITDPVQKLYFAVDAMTFYYPEVVDGVLQWKVLCAGLANSAINDGEGNEIYDYYAPKNNPMFSGIPKVPTATFGTNTTQIASTAFVQAAINGITKWQYEIVGELPPTGNRDVLYLLLVNGRSEPNYCDEFLWVDQEFPVTLENGETLVDEEGNPLGGEHHYFEKVGGLPISDPGKIVITDSEQNLTNKTYEGFRLGNACEASIHDTAGAAVIGNSQELMTERAVRNGLPNINNSHDYSTNTSIYAPTTGGTANYPLVGNGATGTPQWVAPASFLARMGFGYTSCGTAAATTSKTAALTDYQLVTGGIVTVAFTNDVPANATLNINSKGAKAIKRNGGNIAANVIRGGDIATFVYDGSSYQLLSTSGDANNLRLE